MKTLSAMVNHGNNLAGAMDKRDAIDVLTRLHRAGHRLEPESLYGWALANGWNARGADRLREMTSQIAAGKQLRLGMPSALRPDIVDIWRQAANG